ncbi:hypothetical protein phiHau3_70 [Streptomyces phage phiHau3]|uniref:Uncharacterized protein n=1 Tax=Streptomyces phage phiHau3 TaxID=1204524 RepID=K4HYP8_9CAUD|nr:hypothetical protein phiHau3_70 [Streptomyces phage phiHau3]AFU62048.1 hypothetical protein phiHau3_70 [Streptomyces phage phiHau3]
MKIEREAYEIETQAGTFYVTVVTADRDSRYDFDTQERVEVLTPRVWVSTDPQFKGDVDLGSVKIRGRKYTTEYTYKRQVEHPSDLDRNGQPLKWRRDTQTYNRGRRNDQGAQVSYNAKAYDTLDVLEQEALVKFEQEHPNWQAESVLLRFQYERDHANEQAERLHREAAEREVEAAKWQVRIDDLVQHDLIVRPTA